MAKKAFISYSHDDKAFAQKLVKALNDNGVPLFFDEWDIHPGDSIVRKIFEEGLGNSEIFLVILSKQSVQSKWMRDELDAATIRKIEGVTRVVPLIIEDCEIPVALQSLKWIDMRVEFEDGVRKIINVAHGVTERPELGVAPERVRRIRDSISGLSKLASSVGYFMLEQSDPDAAFPLAFNGRDFENALHLSAEEINDAVDELKDRGLVETIAFLGTAPYTFGQTSPTYALFSAFKAGLTFNPEDDVKIVAAAVAAMKQCDGPTLLAHTKLSVGRLNRAAKYLEDYGIVEVVKYLGTAPFAFGALAANRHTRQFGS